jgi:hypothetical protein
VLYQELVTSAWPSGTEFSAPEHEVLWRLALSSLQGGDAKFWVDFLDPGRVGQGYSDEVGFSLTRRLRAGEWRRAVQERRERTVRSGLTLNGRPDPTYSIGMQEAQERIRARAAKESLKALPNEDEDPTRSWPVRSRFLTEVDVEYHKTYDVIHDPRFPKVYYDAIKLERFLLRMLAVVEVFRPEGRAQFDEVRSHLRWWVEHDAAHPPGLVEPS